jgi:predicted nucleic acid-binding protein
MAWLLDTDILSELRRLKPEPNVLAFIARHPLDDLYISVITLAEFRFGIALAGEGTQRGSELNEWITREIRPMFYRRVLPVTEDIMLRWRILVEDGRKRGHTFSQPDLIIAATAAQHGLAVVTRDTSDFIAAAVPVINPWKAD